MINGLKEDICKEMVKSYDIPENLTLAQSPLFNPELNYENGCRDATDLGKISS